MLGEELGDCEGEGGVDVGEEVGEGGVGTLGVLVLDDELVVSHPASTRLKVTAVIAVVSSRCLFILCLLQCIGEV